MRPVWERADFEQIRYANCWEDADVLCAALKPEPGKQILSIASAGDNVLALLAEGAKVVAADISAAQLACLELRCAAFAQFEYTDVLRFLGVRPADDRIEMYRELVPDLSPAARQFWNTHLEHVQQGIIFTGKLERYFHTFRTWIVPLIHRSKTVAKLLEKKSPQARVDFYDQHWNTWRWRLLFRIFFSRKLLGKHGRDAEFFRFSQGSVAEQLLARTTHGLTTLPTDKNPYLEFIFRGNFEQSLPRYLRPEKFTAIRAGLGRLTLHHGPIEYAAQRTGNCEFDGFNLSDIFEYLAPATCLDVFNTLLASAKSGSRLVYWNLLTPRSCPAEVIRRVDQHSELANRLQQSDCCFFYDRLVIEEVH